MSVQTLCIDTFLQHFDVSPKNKELFGEVNTDFTLVNNILDLLPAYLFADPNKKWLDPCCGKGYFSIILYKRLYQSLHKAFPIPNERHTHIIENMIYMIELNGEHIPELFSLFGENANILNGDFLKTINQKYDIIIGNPPFNVNGRIKVPTRMNISKKTDGKMIWADFMKKAVGCLRPHGCVAFITPSIWLKNDNSMYRFMRRYTIERLHTMTNTETNRIFHGQAQTPTCYFVLYNEYNMKDIIELYDKSVKTYIYYTINNRSIPLFGASVFKKLQPFLRKGYPIRVKKTNMPRKRTQFSLSPHKNFPHSNIKTCILNHLNPQLVINYSTIECAFKGEPKLVLAHKMYGFPFLDRKGEYGISNRDNYVIRGKSLRDLERLGDFLSTKFALYLFEGTRYRMKYLEKYVFDLIPDITQLKNFPVDITDRSVSDYFMLTAKERLAVKNLHKKAYIPFHMKKIDFIGGENVGGKCL